MFSLLVSLLAFVQNPQITESEIQVQGLKPGESFIELAPTVEPVIEYQNKLDQHKQYHYIYGRVVDAISREPVVGAGIETWTEELNEFAGGVQRVGEAMSGEDGRFRVLHGEKARIQAPGYLTWSEAAGTLYEDGIPLFPAGSNIPKLKVIDTSGRPIYNAVITSTYTCSHDVPAFEVRTNSQGIAFLRGFGLQDNIQELRLRANGFGGTEYLDGKPALSPNGTFKVVMPRQNRHIDLRFLLADGSPFADEVVEVGDGECYHVSRTNRGGYLKLPYRYKSVSVWAKPMSERFGSRYFGEIDFLPGRTITLRQMAGDWPSEVSTGMIHVQLPDLSATDGELGGIQLFHEDGWSKRVGQPALTGNGIAFPAGKGILHLGGGFRPFAEERIEFDLGDGQVATLTPKWKVQPRFSIALAENVNLQWIEAGGYTSAFEDFDSDVFYPAGERVVLHGFEDDEAKYWQALAPEGALVLSGANELHLVEPIEKANESQKRTVYLHLPQQSSGSGRWQFQTMHGYLDAEPTVVEGQEKVFAIELPSNSPIIGAWAESGFLPAWFQLEAGGNEHVKLELFARASLILHGDGELSFPGFYDASDLKDLHPGITHVVVQLDDGRRVGMRLNMESGEERVITVVRN